MADDFKQIKRSKASQDGRKTFGAEWADKTYTGAAVKAVIDHMMEPAYRPGKGDRLTNSPDAKGDGGGTINAYPLFRKKPK